MEKLCYWKCRFGSKIYGAMIKHLDLYLETYKDQQFYKDAVES